MEWYKKSLQHCKDKKDEARLLTKETPLYEYISYVIESLKKKAALLYSTSQDYKREVDHIVALSEIRLKYEEVKNYGRGAGEDVCIINNIDNYLEKEY
ncbi:MAG TPA: hypothetical protein ENI61_05300 [Ignavibacteria bacterium]|nr:hypothetical protein [Ignavibacteria bacterium]